MCLLLAAQAKPVFTEGANLKVSPYDVKDWLVAFLDGFEINKYANSTVECRHEGSIFYDYTAAGVANYFKHNYYHGSLNISDGLEELPILSRKCYNTTEELSNAFHKYWSQFSGLKDFISTISMNVMSNIRPIKKKGTLILTEFLTSKNYTKVAYLSGQIVQLAFDDGEDDFMSKC